MIQMWPLMFSASQLASQLWLRKAGGIPINIAIEIELVVEGEDERVVQFAAEQRFLLGDFFADVFDNARARRNGGAGKTAPAVHGGSCNVEEIRHGEEGWKTKWSRYEN